MMYTRSTQPFLWLLFSAGGTVAALFASIFLSFFGIIFPLGFLASLNYRHLLAVLDHPLIQVTLFGVCVFALFHCAHRFSYIVRDGLRPKGPKWITTITCYAGAITGSIIAGYILLHT